VDCLHNAKAYRLVKRMDISSFTRKRICSRAMPTGRIRLSDLQLIVSGNGKSESWPRKKNGDPLSGKHFGMDMER
jgi:hypothetical protein